MKKILLSSLVLNLIFVSCGQNELNIEDCSIQLSEVCFTQSINYAHKLSYKENENLFLASKGIGDFDAFPEEISTNFKAPILLKEVNNKTPFTFTTKITPFFRKAYDAGVIYIFANKNWWQKLSFEIDESGQRRIKCSKTRNALDKNNYQSVTHKDVYFKISSDTKNIGFYYSLDNKQWELLRLYKNDLPSTIWLGLSSQSPLGEGMITCFEGCKFIERNNKFNINYD